MSEYLVDVDDGDGVRQGDLIRRPAGPYSGSEWGFVLTADCDIAQNKAGGQFTFLEIVPAMTYLNDIWAPARLKKWIEKQSKVAAEQLGSVIRRSGLNLKLTPEALSEWLADCSHCEVEASLNRTGKPLDAKVRALLAALRAALDRAASGSGLDRFLHVRALLGDDVDRRRRAVREAFEGDGGFPDYFLLPELPDITGYGYVVMLRSFQSVLASDVFSTAIDARIAGRTDAYRRVASG